MEKLELKKSTVIWTIGQRKWLFSFDELTRTFINGKQPYTGRELSIPTQNKILNIIRVLAGSWWIPMLKRIKKYKHLSLKKLQTLEKNGEKLGSGKYGTVYLYNKDYAIKVIKHRYYKNIPRVDGAIEARVLQHFLQKITFNYISPNIVTIYQYTSGKTYDYIVMEKASQTFWQYLVDKPAASIVKGVLLQILFTLAILQATIPGFRHNDLKVDNILFNDTPRTQNITLQYKKWFWKLPKEVPLVKIADFDYSNIPKICANPKVGTAFSKEFGCTSKDNKIYDVHLFLNSVYSHNKKLPKTITSWLESQLPKGTRGIEDLNIKYGRLRNPDKWVKIIKTPLQLIGDSFFNTFRTKKAEYPLWGIA